MTGPTVNGAAGPILRIEGLRVAYLPQRGAGQAPAASVRGVDLDLGLGETLGLVGESGCGKSTIAYAVMGDLPPEARAEGRIAVDGTAILDADGPTLRRLRGATMALVQQNPATAFNPVLTIGRQLREALTAHRRALSAAQARDEILAVMAQVRLPDPPALLRRYPHQLSGGQLQRVAIAMALLARPALLLLDEPTTGLDATVEAGIIELIAEIGRQREMAVMLISHNLGLIARACDRVAVMYAGLIVESGGARQILKAPRHPYTRALIACLPDIARPPGGKRLADIPGRLPAPQTTPPGCIFVPRCHHAQAGRCDVPPGPALVPRDGAQAVRCLRVGEIEDKPARAPEAVSAGPPATPPSTAPTTARPRLVLEDLSKIYGGGGVLRRLGMAASTGTPALDRVSFDVAEGEVVGLIGESGSGKSTLARIVIGLDTATAGAARFDGVSIGDRPAGRRDDALIRGLQIIFQNPDATLNPAHRVGRILGRVVRRLGRKDGEGDVAQRVAALLDRVRLPPETARRWPHELSGGQRQRIAIARAFVADPELVLADEPVSALDVSVQAAVVNLLVEMQARAGTAILFISHDLALVHHLADRVVVLYRGEVVEAGPTGQVFSAPSHPYTDTLLAAIHPADPDHHPRRLASRYGAAPAPGAGCVFAGRCHRWIGPLCDTTPPPHRRPVPGHVIRCHHPVEALVQHPPEGVDSAGRPPRSGMPPTRKGP